MKSAIISLVVIIGIAGAGFFAWKTFGPKPAPAVPVVAVDTRSTYATSTYSVRYPGNFALNAQYAYDQFGPKKLINGVKFTVPATVATGTNLSADTGVSVEQLPRAKNCTGDIYLLDNVTAHDIIENGTEYSFASSTGAAAGNLYDEQVYALATKLEFVADKNAYSNRGALILKKDNPSGLPEHDDALEVPILFAK